MKKLWDKFWALPTIIKVITGIVLLVLALWAYDAATGQIRDLKNSLFDRQQAAIEQKNQVLTDENVKLRAENDQLRGDAKANVDQAIKLQAQEAILDAREKNLDAKTKEELAKTEQALDQQTKDEQVTAQDTDDFTRCVRAKEKLIALNIKSAQNMDCSSFQH